MIQQLDRLSTFWERKKEKKTCSSSGCVPLRAARHTPVRSCRMELDNKRRRGGYDGDAKQSSGAASLKKGREREVVFVVLLCGYGGEGGGGKRSKVVRRAPPKPQENDRERAELYPVG